MNLKNYTSEVPVERTISYIEAYLADCGVIGISKQYEDKIPIAIYFHIEVDGTRFTIRLPARVAEVQKFLWRKYVTGVKRPQKTEADFAEQAARCAWKIQQDWVQVQMSLIKLKQADFLQVFLGFLWDGKQTLHEDITRSGYKGLLGYKTNE